MRTRTPTPQRLSHALVGIFVFIFVCRRRARSHHALALSLPRSSHGKVLTSAADGGAKKTTPRDQLKLALSRLMAAHFREPWTKSLAGCESFLDSESVFVACQALAAPGWRGTF